MRTPRGCRSASASAFWASCASACLVTTLASAQTPAAPSGVAPAASEPVPVPAPAAPEVVPQPPAVTPPGEPPATLPSPPASKPEPEPPYGQLGGQPESEVPEGDWNPWAHGDTTGSYVHEGFFLRLQLGPGGSSVTREGEDWAGIGLGMGLAIGGSPVEDFALHLDFQTSWLFSPERDISSIGMQVLALGVTWYIMPIDIFLSGSAGVGWVAFENDQGQSKDTSAGFAFDALIGKEWWVGADWGIGVAVQVLYAHVQDYTDDKGIDAVAVNALFTATYN
jgi:hypothetical protein